MVDRRRRRPIESSGRRMSEKEKEEYRKRQRRIQKRQEEIERESRMRSIGKNYKREETKEFRENSLNNKKVNKSTVNKDRKTRINKNSKRMKKKLSGKTIFKRIIFGMLILFLIFVGWSIYSVFGLVSKITNNDIISPVPVSMDETVNILLLGLDVGNIDNPKNEAEKRTDTIMVLNYNPSTNKIHLVSIPRDTLININGNRWKMNAAYPIGGDERVITEVEKLLDIKINYLAKLNYKAFREFIDAIGGVNVDIEYDMHYTDKSQKLKIDFDKGENRHLNGKDAEKFFRWRKNNDGTGLPNGDLDRIKNQHKFINNVVKKCTSPLIVFRVPKILNVIGNNIETNMDGITVLKYAFKFITNLHSDSFIMTTLKGTPQMIGGQSYVVATKDENRELIKALNSNNVSLNSSIHDNLKVKVLNGTKIAGLAASYQIELNQKGYNSVVTGNSDLADETVIMVKNSDIKKIIKKDFPNIKNFKRLDIEEYPDFDVVMILGSDAKEK